MSSFSKFFKVEGELALKLHVINLREQHPMLLHIISQKTF